MKTLKHVLIIAGLLSLVLCACNSDEATMQSIYLPDNTLNYNGTPENSKDRTCLVFSDQGAWFGYGIPNESASFGGFTGPFLMTQENGVWSSKVLSQLVIENDKTGEIYDWKNFSSYSESYNSHLHQEFENQVLKVTQTLVYYSSKTAVIRTQIKNKSGEDLTLQCHWNGTIILDGLDIEKEEQVIKLNSSKSTASGYIHSLDDNIESTITSDSSYQIRLESFEIGSGKTHGLHLLHTFVFDVNGFPDELALIKKSWDESIDFLQVRKEEKENQLKVLNQKTGDKWRDSVYLDLMSKSVLTLQNNWRAPAGELRYEGLFPSYHIHYFHGFWAWDSWKHAVAIAHYNLPLAKNQVRAMYDHQTDNGFVPDCLFRDTLIERHNFRNTKPPLSGWAIWEIFEKDRDLDFLKEMYPKLKLQHEWWYRDRDHDRDGICEYGSTDGSLIAAKWESGMDNAVRFDDSQILQNSETAYSLDQESVDLNAYLYAEKTFLSWMAEALDNSVDRERFESESKDLKEIIREQFFDSDSGWFYDTSLDGKTFIKVMSCEGWIPLWAKIASTEEAEAVKNNMMDPDLFYTKVPFQTLAANHPKFEPDGGYWRGPNWLDQAYFGVRALQNYGYKKEANEATYRLIHNAEGVSGKGISIRENYQPITGEGLEAKNFSWSAAHYILLMLRQNQ